jgi:hypothetical protein
MDLTTLLAMQFSIYFLYMVTFLFSTVHLCLTVWSNVSIWIIRSAQELEKDIHGPLAENISADKRLVIFDKIFSAYHDARGFIRADLVLNLLDLFLFNHESITIFLLVKKWVIYAFLLLKLCIIPHFSLSIFIILCILGHCRKCRKCERWFEWSW